MNILSQADALSELCRATQRWGMMLGLDSDSHDVDEICSAAPYLSVREHGQVLIDGGAFILFDSEEECLATYDATVGDDGPTKSNSYAGPARVYALTCGPDGQLHNENT